jgi:hypothetical protein
VPDTARPAQIEVGRAQRQALDSFEAGRCLVLVGERQMESLNQEVEVKAATPMQLLLESVRPHMASTRWRSAGAQKCDETL